MNPEQTAQQSPTPNVEDVPSENVPPTAPPSEAPTTKSRLPLLIGGFIIVLLILGGSYFFLGNREEEVPQPTPVTTQESPTAIPTVDETADWKTYTNIKDGYLLKYPDDWNKLSMSDWSLVLTKSENPQGEFSGVRIKVFGPINILPIPLKNWYLTNSSWRVNEQSVVFSDEFIDEVSVLRVSSKANYGSRPFTVVIVYHNNKYYEISQDFYGAEKSFPVFDQILSTFTFLDQSQLVSCTADTECPQGYFCDYGSSCQLPPPGQDFAICEETGSKTCLKECNTNADCVNETTCQQHSISDGDALFLKKACK